MQITLTKLFRTNKNKDGELLMGKNGKNYERLSIQCQEYGDKWISGFGGQWNSYWNEGDKINIEIKEVTSGDKTYLNFEKIDQNKLIEDRLSKLEDAVFGNKMTPVQEIQSNEMPNSEEDMDVSDIPF